MCSEKLIDWKYNDLKKYKNNIPISDDSWKLFLYRRLHCIFSHTCKLVYFKTYFILENHY